MSKLMRGIQVTAVTLILSAGLLTAAFSLPFTGWKIATIQTASMQPALPPGSLVLLRRVAPNSLHPGDLVTYRGKLDGQLVTRRVVTHGARQTIVKADANQAPDPPITDDQIMGKVVRAAPHLGKAVDFVRAPAGLILIGYVLALVIVASAIRSRRSATPAEDQQSDVPAQPEALLVAQPIRAKPPRPGTKRRKRPHMVDGL